MRQLNLVTFKVASALNIQAFLKCDHREKHEGVNLMINVDIIVIFDSWIWL